MKRSIALPLLGIGLATLAVGLRLSDRAVEARAREALTQDRYVIAALDAVGDRVPCPRFFVGYMFVAMRDHHLVVGGVCAALHTRATLVSVGRTLR